MSTISRKVVTVAKQRFELQRDQVELAMQRALPEPITSHYVVIGRRRYPPKQVIGALTGIDRADFTTHQARRILTGLGFVAGRQPRQVLVEPDMAPEEYVDPSKQAPVRRLQDGEESMRPDAETLEPFVGQWVATRGPDVLVAASDPRTVVSWLAQHRQQADSMFRVPKDELEATGLAPL
jgi:hypothetical protein